MHKFPVHNYSRFSDLPFAELNNQKFSVYIVDFDWIYLYVNDFACELLKKPKEELIGKNMWEVYPELRHDAHFIRMKKNSEDKIASNITTVSPVTAQRINITSQPMDDCFFFSVSILPVKDVLMNELREELEKQKRN